MNTIYILTMVFNVVSNGAPAITSFSAEYNSEQTCNEAKSINRQALTAASIVMSTCTKK